MASRAIHNAECLEKLVDEFNEVNAWLDGLSCVDGKLNLNHRRWRHHVEALGEIRELFGPEAVEAAKLHLVTDFGYIPTRQQVEDMFPAEPELMSWDKLPKA
jgi:hypothetical protein